MPATGTKTANGESSSVPGDGRAPVCVRGVQYVDGNYEGWNFNSGNYLFTTDTK